jgi:hypothetical protein
MMIMRIQFSAFIEACSVEDFAYLMRSLIRNPGGVAECRGMSDCATSRRSKNSSSPADESWRLVDWAVLKASSRGDPWTLKRRAEGCLAMPGRVACY